MDFLEKLNFLMKRGGYNKNSLSKGSGIPYTTIDNWYKRGYDNLQLPTVKKLCSFFGTSLDFWLKEEITDPDYGKTSGFDITYTEMEHIKKYRNLDDFGKESVEIVLSRENERVKEIRRQKEYIENLKTETSTDLIPTRIMIYCQRLASAGTGEYLFDDVPTDMIKVKDTPESRSADFVIGVNGDSMEPDYCDGEKVFVEKTPDIDIGEVGVFVRGDECFIKECGKNGLISRNQKYSEVEPFSGGIKVVGRVIGKVDE